MSEEQQLIQASKQGNTSAFGQLVRKYQSLICAITFSGTGRVDISEELAQETFIRAWQCLFQLKEMGQFRSWLCSIARNQVQNYFRRKKPEAPLSAAGAELTGRCEECPSEQAISREETFILERAMMQISPEYREPLVLFYRQQKSVKEVAENLNLTEATVRTRLYRGRQMIREQAVNLIERTLERTSPDSSFTKSVMIGIGAALAAGAVGTSTASAAIGGFETSIAASGTSSVLSSMAGFLTATSAKVASIAAVIALGAGFIVYTHNDAASGDLLFKQDGSERNIAFNVVESEKAESSQAATIMPNQAGLGYSLPVQQVRLNDPDSRVKPDFVAAPLVRHPDWPGQDEPICSIYATISMVLQDDTERTEKFWTRFPGAFREEGVFDKITIDNGLQRLVLDPNTKQAQLSPSWLTNGQMIWRFHRWLEEHVVVEQAHLYRDPKIMPNIVLTKIATVNNGQTDVYQIIDTDLDDPNTKIVTAYVDSRTLLPERLEMETIGQAAPVNHIKKGTIFFDFSPLPESLFSTSIPKDYQVLPEKKLCEFSGQVVDLMGVPVAGAEVCLYCRSLGKCGPSTSITDEYGMFRIQLPPYEDGFNFTVGLWAKLPNNPDFSAWTLLLSPRDRDLLKQEKAAGFDIEKILSGSMPEITASDDFRYEKTENGVVSEGDWCIGASNIILVMQPANKVFGWVQDTQGNPVPNAEVGVTLGTLANHTGQKLSVNLWDKHPFDFFVGTTNEQGYYEIGYLPKLWNDCTYYLRVSPHNPSLVTDEICNVITSPSQPIRTDIVLLPVGPTVRGVLQDNYGVPLAERFIDIRVAGKTYPGFKAVTDKNGRFELRGCPANSSLQVHAQLSQQGIHSCEKDKCRLCTYFPDVMVDIGYQPREAECEVKLVAVRPELEIEAVVTDSNGNPLPYFPVEVQADEFISNEWKVDGNLQQRTDKYGSVKFMGVPEMMGLRLTCDANLPPLSGRSLEEGKGWYFNRLAREYKKYMPVDVSVQLIEGQKKYAATITLYTEEEYSQQNHQ